MATEAELRFLDVFLSGARTRIAAAGEGWMGRWQDLARRLDEEGEVTGPWAAVRAWQIMAHVVAAGRWWDGSRWLRPEQWRAVHGKPPWEVADEWVEHMEAVQLQEILDLEREIQASDDDDEVGESYHRVAGLLKRSERYPNLRPICERSCRRSPYGGWTGNLRSI